MILLIFSRACFAAPPLNLNYLNNFPRFGTKAMYTTEANNRLRWV